MIDLSKFPRVTHYQLHWNASSGQAKITLHFQANPKIDPVILEGLDSSDLTGLHLMLLNEHPIYWDADNATLLTGPEPVGEEERD